MTTFQNPESPMATGLGFEAHPQDPLPHEAFIDNTTAEVFDTATMEYEFDIQSPVLRDRVLECIYNRRCYLEVRAGLSEGALRDLSVAEINARFFVSTNNYGSPAFKAFATEVGINYRWVGKNPSWNKTTG